MRSVIILIVALLLLPSLSYAETLILKDGTEIETNYYWKEGISRVGYFTDGYEKYVSYDLVDWDAIKNRKKESRKDYQSNTPEPKQWHTDKGSSSATKPHNQFRGYSDDVINLSKPDEGAALLMISGNRAGSHFSIMGYTASGQRTKLLVNTTEMYDGTVLIDIESGVTTSQLEIKASSEWHISVLPLKNARHFQCPGQIEGTGDDVLLVIGANGLMNIYGNAKGSHFAVISYAAMGKRLLVNTTEKYSGRVIVPKEVFIMEIKAVGPWVVNT